jgi:hypothetical protein
MGAGAKAAAEPTRRDAMVSFIILLLLLLEWELETICDVEMAEL